MSRILLVEDEEHLALGLAFNLRNVGYDVDVAASGEIAMALTAKNTYDLLLLDVMLPGIDGLDLTRLLRRDGLTAPILMVSARDNTSAAIAGIEAGADDYIFKPYDLDEVLARIRGSLRRQVWHRSSSPASTADSLTVGCWTIDFQTHEAIKSATDEHDEQRLPLSPKELGILKLFGSRPGEVISRETFLEEVWELPGSLETRTIDNFIHRLRQALEEESSSPKHIVSVRGAGYKFVP